MKKILIAIPTYAPNIPHQVYKALFDMEYPQVDIELQFFIGYTVVQARNRIVEFSLKHNFDYTFFIDADVILPEHALAALLKLNKDISCGWYCMKTEEEKKTVLFKLEADKKRMSPILVDDLPKEPIIEIDGAGFGCVLVKNTVFQAVLDEQKRIAEANNMSFLIPLAFEYQDRLTWSQSEDIDFCLKAKRLGYKIFADLSVFCGHIGTKIY
jgi:hypothetical protein